MRGQVLPIIRRAYLPLLVVLMVAVKRMPYSGCKQAQVGGCKSALVRLGLVWGSSVPGLENIYALVIRLLVSPYKIYKMVIEDSRDFLKIKWVVLGL